MEIDGTILDVTCVTAEAANGRSREALPLTFCGGAGIPVLGRAKKAGDDWDMSAYTAEPETGRCKPLFGALTMDDRENERRRSCWNRLWEVPTAVVVVPLAIGVIVGLATAPVWAPLLLLH
ncbi:MAG: hypothetical protein ACHQ2Z_10960 [Elusimicrobiota bacterium]